MSPTPAPPDVSDLHRPGVPGSWPTATGTSFAVRAPRASAVQLCLFDGADERRVPLESAVDGLWRAHVAGVGAGQRYGYRVDGPWDPVAGDRFTIRAEIDLVVGVTACSAEKSNNGRCTPIDYRIDPEAP